MFKSSFNKAKYALVRVSVIYHVAVLYLGASSNYSTKEEKILPLPQ